MKGHFYVEILDVHDANGDNIRCYFDRLNVCRDVQELLVNLGFNVRFGKEFV